MNILFLFYLPIIPHQGGIQRVTENLTIELQKRGHHICYLSIIPFPKTEYQFPANQYSLDYLTNRQKAEEQYLEIIRNNKIDVVINQQPRFDLLQFLTLAPTNIKKITCYHGQPFPDESFTREQLRYYKRSGFKEQLYKNFCLLFPAYYRKKTRQYAREEWDNSLKASDYVCLLSEQYIQRAKKYMPGIDKEKLLAINNPTPDNFKEIGRFNKKKIILWVGRHDNGTKNFPIFADFWVKFQKSHPDWHAVVLGNGPDWEYNKNYANNKRAQGLSFLGNVTNTQDFYKKASFLFMTSFWEGWGMVLVEAMSSGCIPCAFDTYESLHDIIDNDKNGIIIPPFNIKYAISKIDHLINDTEAMKNLRQNAVEKSQYFSVEKIVSQWELFLNSICTNN